MSIPSAVFLDTSVLAGQQYNFSSVAISSFLPLAEKHSMKVLLPDPTEREIRRQIRERSQDALKALEDARRRAPFLTKWKHFPTAASSPTVANWDVLRIATTEWESFQKQLKMVRLDYSNLDIKKVMDWYDGAKPPFAEGKKRKEFPDAFAFYLIDNYAKRHGCVVAVVSEDRDFKLACERSSSLLYFPSLPKLTEVLLAAGGIVEKLREALLEDQSALAKALEEEASSTEYTHSDAKYRWARMRLDALSLTDVTIVALGDGECTVTFEGSFEGYHLLKWTEFNPLYDDLEELEEWAYEESPFSGTAKLAVDQKASSVTQVILLESDIWETTISSAPDSL